MQQLQDCWCDTDVTRFQDACIRENRFSLQFRSKIEETSALRKIINLLSINRYCTWLELRILKTMAAVSKIPRAMELIELFEECVHQRKITDVEKYFFNEKYLYAEYPVAVVHVKVNQSAKDKKVKDLVLLCKQLEINTLEGSDSVSLEKYRPDVCMEIKMTIPLHCSSHAYYVFKNSLFNLRQLHIRYIQISGFQNKIYVNSISRTNESISTLDNLSSSTCAITCT